MDGIGTFNKNCTATQKSLTQIRWAVTSIHPENVLHWILWPPTTRPGSGTIPDAAGLVPRAVVKEVAFQGIDEGHGVGHLGDEVVGVTVLLWHINAAIPGRVLANLLYGSGAVGTFTCKTFSIRYVGFCLNMGRRDFLLGRNLWAMRNTRR